MYEYKKEHACFYEMIPDDEAQEIKMD